ncbi:MAG: hypothetical protein Tsb002_09980 [Wenzhouxiangellaceae bacterium]
MLSRWRQNRRDLRVKGEPLRLRLAYALEVMAVLPALIIAIFLVRENIQQRYQETRTRLADAASALSVEVEHHLQHHLRGIQSLAASLSQRDDLAPDDLVEALDRFHDYYPGFLTMLATDNDGVIIAGHARHHRALDVVGLSVAERTYFKEPRRSGEAHISKVFLGRGFGSDPIVAIAAPWSDSSDTGFAGVVEGSLDLSVFALYRNHLATLSIADFLILDQDNRVIYATEGNGLQPLQPLHESNLIRAAGVSGPVFEYQQTDEQRGRDSDRLAAQATLGNGWTIIVNLPMSHLDQATRDHLLLTAVALLGGIILALMLAYFMAHRVTQPIQLLVERVRAFQSSGADEPIQAESVGPREVRILFHDVAQMTHSLRESHKALEQVIEQREEEIRQRTLELESAMRAAQAANKAKSDFLANMSHEIRTPISSVMGMNELLLDTPLNDDQRRYAKTIHHSAETLLALLNDILDLTKLESGQLSLEIVEFDLVNLIESAATMLASLAYDKGLEVLVEVDPQLNGVVHGDPTRVRQIVVNLLGNAVKFTESGVVRVMVEATDQEDQPVRISVSDTGPGISPDVQEIIFEKFRQADMSVTRRFGGTGLGLAISKTLVTLMGGHIGLQSRLGEGSCFWFTLPLHVISEPLPGPAWSPSMGPVAIVGGVDSLQTMLHNYLRYWGVGSERWEPAADDPPQPPSQPVPLVLIDTAAVDGWERYCDERFAAKALLLYPLASRPPPIQNLEIDAMILSKPVKLLELAHTLILAMGGRSEAAVRTLPGISESLSVSAEPALPSPVSGKRVLLVEDQKAIQVLAKVMLEQLGLQVDLVSDGAEAVSQATAVEYDLILMDMHMPVMGGAEATTRIRQLGGSRASVPIVALTADALKGTRKECLALSMNDYLAKPFKKAVFQRRVLAWLSPEMATAEAVAESEEA